MSIAAARRLSAALCLLTAVAACQQPAPPARRYPIQGQILAVDTAKQAITIRHDDIPDFMPGMTMTFPVVTPTELEGRVVGEIVAGTLEVSDSQGRLTGLRHVGSAALPANVNQLAMATELLEVGAEVPDAAFVDQADRRRSFAEWRGSVTVVTFIYTSCPLPNYCPLMDQNFATLQGAIAEDAALRGRVKLMSISIDPARDTPAVLAAHAARRKTDAEVWTWLTGDPVTIDKFAGRFGVGILRPDNATEINHNLRTAIVDRAGRVQTIYSGNEWTPGQLLSDLRRAVSAS
jgi:protein SCO1/2